MLRRAIFLASLVMLGMAGAGLAEPGDGIDGTSWKFRPKGVIHWMMFWNRDYLVFQSGNFIQAGLAKRGFTPSLYSGNKTANGIEWSAALQSPEDGRIVWKGTRVSYWMRGTYTRTSPEGRSRTVSWKAWQVFPKAPKN